MTPNAWLAIGATIASLAAGRVEPASLILLSTAVAIASAGFRRQPVAATAARHILAVAVVALGSLAIGVRLLASPGSPPAVGTLPEGSGTWHGVVVAVSSPRDGQQVATLGLELTGRDPTPPPTVLTSATLPRYPPIEPGDRVDVDGRLEPPPDGPYGDYLARIGVEATLFARKLRTTGRNDDPGAQLERARRAAGAALAAAIPEPEAGLAAGIVIGLRDRVDRDLAAAFTTVGASHVVAISGWNIAIVASTVAALAGRLGRRRRSVVLILAIVAYVLFAGSSASVVRAAAMAGTVLLARETGRAGRAAAALGWAAALLLLVQPGLVTDPGFQLSTLATGGILAWASSWTDRIERLGGGGRVPRWLAESLGVSLAAQIATLPVVLLTFGRLALVSPVVNLAIVPLVAPAMAASLVAMLGGVVVLVGGPVVVAAIAGLPAWVLLTAMCTVIRAAASLPIASVAFGPPWTAIGGGASALAILAAPAVARRIAVAGRARAERGRHEAGTGFRVPRPTARRRQRRTVLDRAGLIALVVATVGLGLAFAHRVDGATRITVLDVGQGDSILVEGGRGGRMLVDGGPDPDRLLIELDRRLPPWDRRIDILILTHPHEDHVAGLALLLERYRIGRIYETGMRGPGPGYAAFDRELRYDSLPRALLATGARIALDDIRFRVLWPDPGRVPQEPPDAGRGINDVSVVLLGEVAGRRFLLTGDVEDDVDPILAARGIPPVDILKVAHHGSATASTPAFLGEVRPRVAIVSAGAGNPYGHPARSTIDRLTSTGAQVLRTDANGSVQVTIDPAGQIRVVASGGRKAASAPSVRLASVSGAPVAGIAAVGVTPLLVSARPAFTCGIPSTT